mmetsp:Transcript_34454/g.90958  ORF Transcript_34454/g.90958 Transcript_34454/m.90958 type:complete len:118 (+) Transcript_34454:347-700(+)
MAGLCAAPASDVAAAGGRVAIADDEPLAAVAIVPRRAWGRLEGTDAAHRGCGMEGRLLDLPVTATTTTAAAEQATAPFATPAKEGLVVAVSAARQGPPPARIPVGRLLQPKPPPPRQ